MADLLNGHVVWGHGPVHADFLWLLGLSHGQVLPELLPGSAAHLQGVAQHLFTVTVHWFLHLRHVTGHGTAC